MTSAPHALVLGVSPGASEGERRYQLFANLGESAHIVRDWDELELAARLREGLWHPNDVLLARIEQEFAMSAHVYEEIDRFAAGELTSGMLRAAALAVLYRDRLQRAEYDELTAAFATLIGAVHPADKDRLPEIWGRRGPAIRAFLSTAAEMSELEFGDPDLTTTSTEAALREARVVALSALLGAGRQRVGAFDPSQGWEDGRPFTDALLATECADLVEEDSLLDEGQIQLLAKAWFAGEQEESNASEKPPVIDEAIESDPAQCETCELTEALAESDEWRDLLTDRLPWVMSDLRNRDHLAMGALSVQRLASIAADIAIEGMTHWTIGDLFAVLPETEWFQHDVLPSRLRNRLTDGRTSDGTELRDLTLQGLTLLRGVGLQSVHGFLTTLAERSLQVAPGLRELAQNDGVAGKDAAPRFANSSLLPAPMLPHHVLQDFNTLLNWHQLTGLTSVPLLARLAGAEPLAVRSARDRILALNLSSVVPGVNTFDGLAARIEDAINQLGERAIVVLRRRLFADTATRLDDIGLELGVTRSASDR